MGTLLGTRGFPMSIHALAELEWKCPAWSVTALPTSSGFSTLQGPASLCQRPWSPWATLRCLGTQQQWMPEWFIWHLAYAVWIVFYIFIALSGLPSLTEDTLKGENTIKMETTVFASVGSWLQTLPSMELAYRVTLCTPSHTQCLGTTGYPSSLLSLLSIWCFGGILCLKTHKDS